MLLAQLLQKQGVKEPETSHGSSSVPTATLLMMRHTGALPGISAAGVLGHPPASPTGTLPTAPPGRTPSAWVSRSSAKRRSVTGRRATAGKQLVFCQSLWAGLGRIDSTSDIGRRALGNYSVLEVLGSGLWWMWSWYQQGILDLQMGHYIYNCK